ncbi:flavin monoamine oxidase family protein [Mucilaginibacter litoreus]|uniref:Tryptophan 2-monooxygenase n=1 Tax=Mucilaginibacter litoreus TaxID=1048221 RepID=A0ABW3APS6_9SPHI
MKNTVLIIGAGAAGLMAAYTLSKAGKHVTVLEARNRTGGRIHTLNKELFFKETELGAEFIHGDLPVTKQLLKDAGISGRNANAEMWSYKDGKFERNSIVAGDWDALTEKLDYLQQDIPIWDFLLKEFPGDEHGELRKSLWAYVSGYDTADPRKASTFSLRKEWENEDQDAQQRIEGGYCAVINYLAGECKNKGGQVFLNAIVKQIQWQKGLVKAITEDGMEYEAEQLVIALPLGVLKVKAGSNGAVVFDPPIHQHAKAIQQMGFGAVIKILFEFNTPFWLDEQTKKMAGDEIEQMGYLFSEEEIPTWWTQAPNKSNVLTGWIGGPAAEEKADIPDKEILEQGLQSLANIFNRDYNDLKGKLNAYRIMNWTADPYTRGSYAYDTVEAPQARTILNTPIDNTIYFAGEYLYEGTAMGTVEAALSSGLEAAKKVLK